MTTPALHKRRNLKRWYRVTVLAGPIYLHRNIHEVALLPGQLGRSETIKACLSAVCHQRHARALSGQAKVSTFSSYKRPLKMTQLKEDGGGGGGDPFTQGSILHMNRAKIRVCLTFCTGWLNSLIPHQLKLKTTISFSSIMDDLNCDSTFVCLFVCLLCVIFSFFVSHRIIVIHDSIQQW